MRSSCLSIVHFASILVMLTVVFLTSCGSYFGPSVAGDVTLNAQIAGRWSGGAGLGCEGTVLLTLSEAGTYELRVTSAGVPTVTHGQWGIVDGGWVHLEGWSGFATTYPVEGKNPAGYLLYGGATECGDPDQWEMLRWQGPVEPSANASTPESK